MASKHQDQNEKRNWQEWAVFLICFYRKFICKLFLKICFCFQKLQKLLKLAVLYFLSTCLTETSYYRIVWKIRFKLRDCDATLLPSSISLVIRHFRFPLFSVRIVVMNVVVLVFHTSCIYSRSCYITSNLLIIYLKLVLLRICKNTTQFTTPSLPGIS